MSRKSGRIGKAAIIEAIRAFHKKNNRAPGYADLGTYMVERARIQFGTFEAAVTEALGAGHALRHIWTTEEISAALQKMNADLHRLPTTADVAAVSNKFEKAINHKFGSLCAALEAALGVSPRTLIAQAIADLTPHTSGVVVASALEIQSELTRKNIEMTAMQVSRYCSDMSGRGLLESTKPGRVTLYSLTSKGRDFLKGK